MPKYDWINLRSTVRILVNSIVNLASVAALGICLFLAANLTDSGLGEGLSLFLAIVMLIGLADRWTGYWLTQRLNLAGKFGRKKLYAGAFLVPAVVTGVLLLVSSATATTNTTKWPCSADRGGATSSGSMYIGPWSVEAWHTGCYPIGGFVDYRVHVRVNWGLIQSPIGSIDLNQVDVQAYSSDEKYVDIQPYASTKKYYACRVPFDRVFYRARGCAYFFFKWKVTIKVPVKGDIGPFYPWVAIWIRGNGDLPRTPAWSTGAF